MSHCEHFITSAGACSFCYEAALEQVKQLEAEKKTCPMCLAYWNGTRWTSTVIDQMMQTEKMLREKNKRLRERIERLEMVREAADNHMCSGRDGYPNPDEQLASALRAAEGGEKQRGRGYE